MKLDLTIKIDFSKQEEDIKKLINNFAEGQIGYKVYDRKISLLNLDKCDPDKIQRCLEPISKVNFAKVYLKNVKYPSLILKQLSKIKLVKLFIHDSGIEETEFSILRNVLNEAPIKELKIKRCEFKKDAAESMFQNFLAKPSLKTIDLGGTGLTDSIMKSLGESLSSLSLENLLLQSTGLNFKCLYSFFLKAKKLPSVLLDTTGNVGLHGNNEDGKYSGKENIEKIRDAYFKKMSWNLELGTIIKYFSEPKEFFTNENYKILFLGDFAEIYD